MNPDELFTYLQKLDHNTQLMLLAISVCAILANLLYYRTLQKTMGVISPGLRPCAPVLVWLALVPFFGVLWYMVYIVMLSFGLQKELARRRLAGNGAIGITLGTVLLFALFLVPSLRVYVVLPALVFWLMHWQRMAVYHKLLVDPVYLIVE